MTQKELQKRLRYERVRAMIAGYQQSQRGVSFSERMEAEDEILNIINQHVKEVIGKNESILKVEPEENKIYWKGYNQALKDCRKRAGL